MRQHPIVSKSRTISTLGFAPMGRFLALHLSIALGFFKLFVTGARIKNVIASLRGNLAVAE